MKKILCILLCAVLIVSGLPIIVSAADTDFLIDDWSTSDGITLSFYDDGYFEMEWSYFPAEEGKWYAEALSDDTFYIELEGSLVLTLMSMIYGSADSDYHFEILKCNEDNFYLVQVYGGYTAKTSPCKLGFTRYGADRDFGYKKDVEIETERPTEAPTEKPTEKKTVRHTIQSDYGDDRLFYFKENEEIEDLVLSKKSTQYNPRLAHFLSYMARSAYNEDLVTKNYLELGFMNNNQWHYVKGDPIAPFTIGEKNIDNGTKMVLITIRGSGNLFDFSDNNTWTQSNFNLGNSAMLLSVGLHSGFLANAEEAYKELKKFLGGSIPNQGVKYVISGHSLGAATSNILAVKLYDDGVPNSDVYDYNFACPNVGMGLDDISAWNDNGVHNNIINIGNWCDLVTHEPGLAVESLSVTNRKLCLLYGWKKWKRFGVSYWFDNGFQLWKSAHDMSTYIDYTEKELDESHFRDTEYVVQSVWSYCPVDIDIYDSAGNLIAGTINNEPNYYDYEIGEKAVIYVNEDRKLIHILSDEQYEVRLRATDEGEMEYGVGLDDLTSGETKSQKSFQSVKLTKGKELFSKIGGEIKTEDVKLYVIDENDKAIAEVMTDGTEKEVDDSEIEVSPSSDNNTKTDSLPWWVYILIGFGMAAVVAGIISIIIIIKKKKRKQKKWEDYSVW